MARRPNCHYRQKIPFFSGCTFDLVRVAIDSGSTIPKRFWLVLEPSGLPRARFPGVNCPESGNTCCASDSSSSSLPDEDDSEKSSEE